MHARPVRHHNIPAHPTPTSPAHTQPPDRGYAHNRDTPQNHTEYHKTHRCGRAGQANCAGAATSTRLARIAVRAELEDSETTMRSAYVVHGYM